MGAPRDSGLTEGEYLKAIRTDAFARGLCYECCSRPHRPGRKRCQECADMTVARRAPKFAAGACRGMCGRQAIPGRSRCTECAEKHRVYKRGYDQRARERRAEQPLPARAVPPTRPYPRRWRADNARVIPHALPELVPFARDARRDVIAAMARRRTA